MRETNFNEFIEQLKNALYQKLGREIRIDIHETVKNNGVTYRALAILRDGCNISPNIRIDGFYRSYREGTCLDEITAGILEIYQYSRRVKIDLSFFTDFEKAKEHILFKIVGFEKNRERLKEIPHFKFLDLALTFYLGVELAEKEGNNASVQIEKEHLKMWNINEGILYDIAMKNTVQKLPVRCRTICDIILEMLEQDGIKPGKEAIDEFMEKTDRMPMYVLSNPRNYFGAAVLYYPGILKQLGEELQSDLIILPSSVHEIIILPADGKEDAKELNEMITDINTHQVAAEEVLSDHMYYYDRERDELRMPSL